MAHKAVFSRGMVVGKGEVKGVGTEDEPRRSREKCGSMTERVLRLARLGAQQSVSRLGDRLRILSSVKKTKPNAHDLRYSIQCTLQYSTRWTRPAGA